MMVASDKGFWRWMKVTQSAIKDLSSWGVPRPGSPAERYWTDLLVPTASKTMKEFMRWL
jgi:hypothetical protein